MNRCCYSGIWSNQTLNVSLNVFKNMIKTGVNDQYCQLWRSDVFESNNCFNYRIVKHTLSMETYFRCINNQLPIETGSRHNIPRDMRYCTFCETREIGDEYHYILICNFFQASRKKYIKTKYTNRPSALKMANLMNAEGQILFNLCKFIEIVMLAF